MKLAFEIEGKTTLDLIDGIDKMRKTLVKAYKKGIGSEVKKIKSQVIGGKGEFKILIDKKIKQGKGLENLLGKNLDKGEGVTLVETFRSNFKRKSHIKK